MTRTPQAHHWAVAVAASVLMAVAGCSVTPGGAAMRIGVRTTPPAYSDAASKAEAAAATPRWGPPEVIARGQSEVDGGSSSQVAMYGGWALGSWETANGIRYALREPDKGWSVQGTVRDAWMGDVAVGRAGSAMVTWRAPRNAVSNGAGSLFERHREGGQWSEPVVVSGGTNSTAAAIDAHGGMTLAWAGDRGVDVMTRPAEGTWETVTHFAPGQYTELMELTTNRRGDLLLAWQSSYDRVRTAFHPYGGDWVMGPALKGSILFYSLGVALNDQGQALVMWGRDTDEGDYAKRYLAWSMRKADGTWTDTKYLDTRPTRSALGVDNIGVSLNNHGAALAVWASQENGPSTSRVARFDPGSGWSTPTNLKQPGVDEALLTETGDAIVALATAHSGRHFWWHQLPDGQWQRHGLRVRAGVGSYPTGSGLSLDSAGRRMVTLAVMGNVVSRHLRVPTA